MSDITIQDKQFNSGLFNNIKSIKIPPYQRQYCWDKKDCKELFDDILNIYNKKDFSEKHYIGSLVVIAHENKKIYEIIDGQQRLTTISILFFVIKNLLEEFSQGNEKLLGKIERDVNEINEFLYDKSDSNEKIQKLKLKHLNQDADIYKDLLEGKSNNQKFNNKTIKINYNYFLSIIKSFIEENKISLDVNKINFLIEIHKIIQQRLIFAFVTISNSNLNNSQKIFESLNNTGKKLSSSDLIRNFVLMPEISERVDDENSQKEFFDDWDNEIENRVSSKKKSSDLDDFYRYYLVLRTGAVISNNSIYQRFKKLTKDKKFLEKNIFQDVKKIANLYYQIKEKNDDRNIEELLKNFRLLNLWSITPFLIFLFENKDVIDEKDFYISIKMVINFCFRMSSVDNTKSIVPATLINTLKNQNDWQKNILEILPSILKMPNDDDVKKALLSKDHKKDLQKFILMAIEENLSMDKQKDYSKLEREHILAIKHRDANKFKDHIQKLGNFTWATSHPNKEINNKDILEKIKEYYNSSSFKLNLEIEKIFNESNHDIALFIEKRGEILSNRVLSIFAYSEPKYTLNASRYKTKDTDEPDLTLDLQDIELANQKGKISNKKPQFLIIKNSDGDEIDRIDCDEVNYSWKNLIEDFNQILKTKFNYNKNFDNKKPRTAHRTLNEMNNMWKDLGFDGKQINVYIKDEYE